MMARSLAIWETEVQIYRSENRAMRIKINLRLWSYCISIADILKVAKFEVDHCHRLGDMIVINGRSTGRVAPRHYAALQNLETNDVGRLSKWLSDTQKRIEASEEISLRLKSGEIEGIIWIALFGDEVQRLPSIDEFIIAKLAKDDVRILIENYTDLDEEGLPRRIWLTSLR